MANAGAKLSSFPEVNDIQTGDMFPLLSGGNTNAKIDYATLANAIIAKEVERATAAENKLESEKANKTTATASADGLMSKSAKAKLDGIGAGSNVKSVNGKTGAVTLRALRLLMLMLLVLLHKLRQLSKVEMLILLNLRQLQVLRSTQTV